MAAPAVDFPGRCKMRSGERGGSSGLCEAVPRLVVAEIVSRARTSPLNTRPGYQKFGWVASADLSPVAVADELPRPGARTSL